MNQKMIVAGGAVFIAVILVAIYIRLSGPLPLNIINPFQPSAQMLLSATKPAESLEHPESMQSAASRNTPLPYTFDQTMCSSKTKNSEHFGCLETYYQGLVENRGVDVAFSDLKKRYSVDTYVASNCHPFTHVIGRAAVDLYPTVSKAYEHGDSFCWSGYYHGVLEGIIKNIGVQNLQAEMDTICADIPGKSTYNFDYYNCVHGLGHGVMELSGDDVFASLDQCDYLAGGWEQQSCDSGVFMENIIVYERDGSSPGLKPSEPLYPCTAVSEKHKYQCYLGQTSYVLNQNGGNFKATFDMCAKVEGSYRSVCNQSIGRDAANYAGRNGEKTKTTCMLATSSRDSNDCIIGAVKEFISYYHGTAEANAFCDLLDVTYKVTCVATGTEYFKIF